MRWKRQMRGFGCPGCRVFSTGSCFFSACPCLSVPLFRSQVCFAVSLCVPCSGGELRTGIHTVSCCDARLMLLGKKLPVEFAPTTHPDFLENRLEVVLYGVGRDVKHLRNFSRGQPTHDALYDLALPFGEMVGLHEQGCHFRWPGYLKDHRDLPRGMLWGEPRGVQHQPMAVSCAQTCPRHQVELLVLPLLQREHSAHHSRDGIRQHLTARPVRLGD